MPTKTYWIQNMIKRIIFALLIASSTLAEHAPSSEKKNFNPYGIFRVFKKLDHKHTLMGQTLYRKDNDRNVFGAELSYRRKVSKHIQYGIEADIYSGIRHDNDWIKENGSWKWKDEGTEFGASLFLKFKRGLYFLPGTNWIGEINLKTHNNLTETLLSLKPEFKLTYIHFENGKPLYNIYTKFKYYVPLNYSSKDIYGKWLYLGTMLHWKKNLKPFIFLAYSSVSWTKSEEFENSHLDEDYDAESKLSHIGIGLNYYLD